MFKEEIIQNNTHDILEGMTSISALIKSIKNNTNNRKILKIFYDNIRTQKNFRELKFLKSQATELGFELIAVDVEYINSMTTGNTHGGFIAVCTPRKLELLSENSLINPNGFYTLIEGIEDPYNFGYSVRSLYASGADGLILPQRNWLEFSGTVARSSAGTSELFDILVSDPEEAVNIFKQKGFTIVCAGIRNSISIYEADLKGPVLLIVGGEKRGISRKLMDMSDFTVRIDYGREFGGSLPTASAISVMAFEILRSRKK